MRGSIVRVVLAAAFVSSACGDSESDGGGPGLGTGGCLTDEQICQFEVGVSTQDDVTRAIGNAQTYLGNGTSIYVCQMIAGQQIVHNDQVIFDFDSSGKLSDVTVFRQGTGATPPPDCAKSSP